MWTLRRRDRKGNGGATALAERPTDFTGAADEELFEEIERLTEANRISRDADVERELLRLRNLAGLRVVKGAEGDARHPNPDTARLSEVDGLPEFAPEELTPGLLRAAILRDGCVLVRGLVPREDAARFAEYIDLAFVAHDLQSGGQPHDDGYYSEFAPQEGVGEDMAREWVREGGGVLAADSPMPSFEMMEMFHRANLPALVRGYLGEPALITAQKTTLRKAEPSVPGAWHQDGKFLGPVRALNLWLSLSRCGDLAPGLDIVPRRIDDLVTTQTEEAMLDYMISQKRAEEAAGDTPIIRPIFEPGDALLFDELFMHKTGSDPSMPNPRFAIENWFFGASGFPTEYAPIAV
jgi:hypothetical protein